MSVDGSISDGGDVCRLRFEVPAKGYERFAPDAFARVVGRRVPVRLGDSRLHGDILAAEVDPDGTTAYITVELNGVEVRPTTEEGP